jgi:hypothetical protein
VYELVSGSKWRATRGPRKTPPSITVGKDGLGDAED